MRSGRFKNIFVGTFIVVSILAESLNFSVKAADSAESASTGMQQTFSKPSEAEPGQKSIKKGTIRISCWYDEDYLSNLKAYLSDTFPEYKFEYLYLDKSNYEFLIDGQLASKDAPDIVCVDPSMVKKHAKAGYIVDVSNLTEGFLEYGKQPFAYGDGIYAVPATNNFECIYYNARLFEDSGREVPNSFEEFVELCDFFRIAREMKPLSAGYKEVNTASNCVMMFVAASYFRTTYGRSFNDRVQFGKASFYDELLPYLEPVEVMTSHKIIAPRMYTMDRRAAIMEFAGGKSAMMLGRPGDYNEILEENPDIELGTFTLMSTSTGDKMMLGGCELGFAVNASGKNIDTAKAVVASLATVEGQKAIWLDRQGSNTYLKGYNFKNPAAFDNIKPILAKNNLTMPSYDWGPNSRELYNLCGKSFQRVLMGEIDIEQALKDLDEDVQLIREEE